MPINLSQPPDIPDKKLHQWLFLLWKYVLSWTGENQNNVISTRVYSPHPTAFYTSQNAVESENILAGQIFGS